MATKPPPLVVLAVMSNPSKPTLRTQWRQWANQFSAFESGAVSLRFAFGVSFYEKGKRIGEGKPVAESQMLEAERSGGDLLFVRGRERLPHVGVVTEKSAAWWSNAASYDAHARWFCKCDDDTLVHLDRLKAVLAKLEREQPKREIYFGHMKWRGWDVGDRFQACGGTWGDARKTMTDIVEGGIEHGSKRYPNCPHAAGPYPYMSGGMVCMSRALAERMATDAHFSHFQRVAQQRNTDGTACSKPRSCAAQPAESHMWHHEDAGIGYNVFRAVVASNATALFVPVPAHYNDPGIIERSVPLDDPDRYWSSRAVFVHGIKLPKHFQMAQQRWNLSRSFAEIQLQCYPCDKLAKGANRHYGHWSWARVPCAGEESTPLSTGRFCPVAPADHFTCCHWPWVIPKSAAVKAASSRSRLIAAKRRMRGVAKG